MARFFPFILEAKHKTPHIIWAWAELEILQKKQSYHVKQRKYKEHNDMMIQENQTSKKLGEDLT